MGRDPDCIFCKIAAGQVPCDKVLDDNACLAFLDISPLAEGHVLLVPKRHAETLADLSADEAAAVLRHLPALVRAVSAVTGCEGVNVLQNNGRAASQLVMHAHVHVIPRKAGDEFHFNWPAGTYPPGRADELARRIAEELSA